MGLSRHSTDLGSLWLDFIWATLMMELQDGVESRLSRGW
jgi:hypothetical protein